MDSGLPYNAAVDKNQALDAAAQHRLKQRERRGCVVAEVDFRALHRLAGLNQCRKVEHRVKRPSLVECGPEDSLDLLPVGQLSLDKLNARWH